MLAEIENLVTYCEPPPFYSVDTVQNWNLYLSLRTSVVLDIKLDALDDGDPNPEFGNWETIPLL